MIREALADQGLKAADRGAYLHVACCPGTEFRIQVSPTTAGFDVPVADARGFVAEEHDTGDGDDISVCLYETGPWFPGLSLEAEVRALAAAVNRMVSQASGPGLLVARPLARFMPVLLAYDGLRMWSTPAARDKVKQIFADAEECQDGVGALLLRKPLEPGDTLDDALHSVWAVLESVWITYSIAELIPDEHCMEYGVRPVMIQQAYRAAQRWYMDRIAQQGAGEDWPF